MTYLIGDLDTVLADLEQAWAGDDPPCTSFGAPTRPVRDHPLGQPLGDTDNPYWQIVRLLPIENTRRDRFAILPDDTMPEIPQVGWSAYPLMAKLMRATAQGQTPTFDITNPLMKINWDILRPTFCWPIISPADLAVLTAAVGDRGVIEIGAGSGYLAWQLAQLGVDTVAVDTAADDAYPARYHPVKIGGPEQTRKHDERVLLLSWPPQDDPMAVDSLTSYRGDTVIYIGEFNGCTADRRFFHQLFRNWTPTALSTDHLSYWNMNCHVTVWQRLPRTTRRRRRARAG